MLWDCIPLLDEALVGMFKAFGGLSAIAISHPHYYTTMVDWAKAFHCRVYLHAADRQWVMRPDPCFEFWSGETKELAGGLTLIRCGGHFDGGTVLHWPSGADGRGALLSGDILQVVPDRRWVSFMYSYPNYIPLPASAVEAGDTGLSLKDPTTPVCSNWVQPPISRDLHVRVGPSLHVTGAPEADRSVAWVKTVQRAILA